MEQFPRIEQRNDSENAPDELNHREAVEFVEKHRDFFEHYARGRVKFEPAPEGLNTFAFDLKNETIYVNSRFYEKLDFSDERTSFATLHEIEHFLEKKEMLGEEGGDRAFERYLKRIKESKAYSLMDNCVADVRENRAVTGKTTKDFRELEIDLYKKDLLPESDFTSAPRHIQFCSALLREARVPGQKCAVALEVREKLDALKEMKTESGANFFEILTNPDVSMSFRIALQNERIWPVVKELLDEDVKEREGKKDGKGKEKKSKPGEPAEEKLEEVGPNEIFKAAYETAEKAVPNAVPLDEIEKAFEEWRKDRAENPLERADKEYAERLGVKKEELQKYRNIVKSLERVKNPETDVSVIEELRELIAKIIAHRMKPAPAPRYPVEEGEELVDPAELVAQAKAGNLEPKVWETFEIKEKKGKKFGEVEITLVVDRSGSMTEGAKLWEQQKAAVLMMEALKEFSDACDEERVNLDKPLEVRSEIYSFQATVDDAKPLKKMSKELEEKQRIEIASILSLAPGKSTTDFVPLETILANMDKNLKQKIAEGEVKKIVIVLTDGESDNAQRVKNALERLRSEGVVAVGVGITEAGRPALGTYAPDARLAETAEKLPVILSDLLKEHLSDI